MNTVTDKCGDKFLTAKEVLCYFCKTGKAGVILLSVIFVVHFSLLEYFRRSGFQHDWGYDWLEKKDSDFQLNRVVLGFFIDVGYIGPSFKTGVVRRFNTLVDILLIRQQVPGAILKQTCDGLYSFCTETYTFVFGPYEKYIPELDTLSLVSLAVQMMANIIAELFNYTWFVSVVLSIALLFLFVIYKHAMKKTLDNEWKWSKAPEGIFSAWMGFTDMCGVPGWICFIMIVPGWYCWDTDGLAGMFLYAIMVFVFGVIACATITRF